MSKRKRALGRSSGTSAYIILYQVDTKKKLHHMKQRSDWLPPYDEEGVRLITDVRCQRETIATIAYISNNIIGNFKYSWED
jgi:hypothetical protein